MSTIAAKTLLVTERELSALPVGTLLEMLSYLRGLQPFVKSAKEGFRLGKRILTVRAILKDRLSDVPLPSSREA